MSTAPSGALVDATPLRLREFDNTMSRLLPAPRGHCLAVSSDSSASLILLLSEWCRLTGGRLVAISVASDDTSPAMVSASSLWLVRSLGVPEFEFSMAAALAASTAGHKAGGKVRHSQVRHNELLLAQAAASAGASCLVLDDDLGATLRTSVASWARKERLHRLAGPPPFEYSPHVPGLQLLRPLRGVDSASLAALARAAGADDDRSTLSHVRASTDGENGVVTAVPVIHGTLAAVWAALEAATAGALAAPATTAGKPVYSAAAPSTGGTAHLEQQQQRPVAHVDAAGGTTPLWLSSGSAPAGSAVITVDELRSAVSAIASTAADIDAAADALFRPAAQAMPQAAASPASPASPALRTSDGDRATRRRVDDMAPSPSAASAAIRIRPLLGVAELSPAAMGYSRQVLGQGAAAAAARRETAAAVIVRRRALARLLRATSSTLSLPAESALDLADAFCKDVARLEALPSRVRAAEMASRGPSTLAFPRQSLPGGAMLVVVAVRAASPYAQYIRFLRRRTARAAAASGHGSDRATASPDVGPPPTFVEYSKWLEAKRSAPRSVLLLPGTPGGGGLRVSKPSTTAGDAAAAGVEGAHADAVRAAAAMPLPVEVPMLWAGRFGLRLKWARHDGQLTAIADLLARSSGGCSMPAAPKPEAALGARFAVATLSDAEWAVLLWAHPELARRLYRVVPAVVLVRLPVVVALPISSGEAHARVRSNGGPTSSDVDPTLARLAASVGSPSGPRVAHGPTAGHLVGRSGGGLGGGGGDVRDLEWAVATTSRLGAAVAPPLPPTVATAHRRSTSASSTRPAALADDAAWLARIEPLLAAATTAAGADRSGAAAAAAAGRNAFAFDRDVASQPRPETEWQRALGSSYGLSAGDVTRPKSARDAVAGWDRWLLAGAAERIPFDALPEATRAVMLAFGYQPPRRAAALGAATSTSEANDAAPSDEQAPTLGLVYPDADAFRRDARAAAAAAARVELAREVTHALPRAVRHDMLARVAVVPHAAWTRVPGLWCDVTACLDKQVSSADRAC